MINKLVFIHISHYSLGLKSKVGPGINGIKYLESAKIKTTQCLNGQKSPDVVKTCINYAYSYSLSLILIYLCFGAALCCIGVVVHIIGEQGHEERKTFDMSRARLSTVEGLERTTSLVMNQTLSSLISHCNACQLYLKPRLYFSLLFHDAARCLHGAGTASTLPASLHFPHSSPPVGRSLPCDLLPRWPPNLAAAHQTTSGTSESETDRKRY